MLEMQAHLPLFDDGIKKNLPYNSDELIVWTKHLNMTLDSKTYVINLSAFSLH